MMPRSLRLASLIVSMAFPLPALAGPPFLSDDPIPTDYRHFEIYTFNSGTKTQSGVGGIDFNYGAAPNLQLTATFPVGFDSSVGTRTHVGVSNLELAAKYQFLHQSSFGLDVSVFPRVFLPSASRTVGDRDASLLLPIWIQKDWDGGWSAFGGGGCVLSARSEQNSCLTGAVLNYQLLPKLQVGVELFHQTADSSGTSASTSVGVGFRYDLNDNYHLLGYVNRGLQNVSETNQYSWYSSLLFTF